MSTLDLILLVAAFVLALIGAFWPTPRSVSLLHLAFACYVLSLILP